MGWLAQNWVWVVLGAAIAWFFFRGGLSGALRSPGGHGSHGGHGGQPEDRALSSPASAPEAAIDPVGGEAVRTAQAVTSVYQGMIYYFASKENRDRFEGAPQEYAPKAAGHPVRPAEAANERPRRRGGC